jgi:hypothetical protein
MSDLDAALNPRRDARADTAYPVAADMRLAVEEALAGARQVQMAAAGRAAAQRAEIAGARYSSRTVDADGTRLGRVSDDDVQSAVDLLAQAIHDLSDQELLVVRREEELLEYVASLLSPPGRTELAPRPLTTAEVVTAETPLLAEIEDTDDPNPGEESPWRRIAIMVGLAVLTFVGLIAFLIAP